MSHELLVDALARGRLALAELAAIPPVELAALFETGAQLLEVGREHDAAELLGCLVALFPFSARFWRGYGVALHRLGELNRALGAYEASRLLEPNHGDTECFRAELLIYQGRTREAAIALAMLTNHPAPHVATRARALLGELPNLPQQATAPTPAPLPLTTTHTFTLTSGEPLPLARTRSAEASTPPTARENTAVARAFAWVREEPTAPSPWPDEPSVTATAVVRRRLPIAADPAPFGAQTITETALLPGRSHPSPEARSEITETAIRLRQLGVPLTATAEPTAKVNR